MKIARQFPRAVKHWGVGDEMKCSRRQFTQWRQAERWTRRHHGKGVDFMILGHLPPYTKI